MEKLKKCISDAYYKNEENFKKELRTILHEGEYSLNQRTKIIVRGFFDEEECRPFIQFDINTDEVSLATVFYRYDYSSINKNTVDEHIVLMREVPIVDAIILQEEDIS